MTTLVACRACGHPSLEPYCDLGMQPLANAFLSDLTKPEETYPLTLAHCPACFLSQLTVVVDPDLLYRDYAYVSGASPSWVAHCDALVQSMGVKGKTVVEVASNDGTLLTRLANAGATAIGVDPATNLTRQYPDGVHVIPDYFTDKTARWIKTRYGHADYVIAQNVIGHVDDIKGFLYAVKTVLKQTGTAILEAPYLYQMLQREEFPQVYHEHLSYWSVLPLYRVACAAGLVLVAVRPLDVHGGSMRYYLRHHLRGMPDDTVHAVGAQEQEMQRMDGVPTAFDPHPRIQRLTQQLESSRGKTVWGYGASAKATVLLNTLPNASLIAKIIDDHEGKQGKYMPGVHTPIVPPQDLSGVDVLVVLAWNWVEAITAKAEALGFKGQYLIPF